MDRRLELHEILCDILGSRNVYFQPPESKKMQYPCIVYERNNGDTQFADNKPYEFRLAYDVTLIDKNPDSKVLLKIAALPLSRFNRHYTADNLNHDSFVVYY